MTVLSSFIRFKFYPIYYKKDINKNIKNLDDINIEFYFFNLKCYFSQ